MNRMKYIGILVFGLMAFPAYGQKMSLSTNLAGYLNFGTMNMELSCGTGRHWSVTAGARYNPFSFKWRGRPARNRQQSYCLGTRFWPWHIYSGWWISGKFRYQEYSTGGIMSPETEEGDRLGAGLSAGYTYMLHPHINIEFGLGFWAGAGKYVRYSSPSCGVTLESGIKGFVLPDDIIIGISYVF